jgi:tetratricopeptide (TPR) repeat protein
MKVKKLIWIAGTVVTAIMVASVIVFRMLSVGHVEPLTLLLLAGAISIMLPMIRANFFPGAKDCDAEFAFHTRRQEAFIQQQVVENLGQAAFQRISTQPSASNENPNDYLLALLASKEVESHADLRFALRVALSRYHEKAGDPQAAIENLTAALELRPQDFVTLFNLARYYDWQGNPAEAQRILRKILAAPAGLSRAMIKLTHRRMEELEAGQRNHADNA